LTQRVQDVKEFSENTCKTLGNLADLVEKEKKASAAQFNNLHKAMTSLGSMAKDHDSRLCSAGESLKVTEEKIRQLRGALEQSTNIQQSLQEAQSHILPTMKDLQSRFRVMEERHSTECAKLGGGQLVDHFLELLVQVGKCEKAVNQVEKDLWGGTSRLDVNGGDIGSFASMLKRIEGGVEQAEREVKNISGWRQVATNKMEAQGIEISKQKDHLTETTRNLDVASAKLDRVSGELETTNSIMKEISQGVDLCHDYFQGLGKGFKDTHLRVMAEDSMLSPRCKREGARGFGSIKDSSALPSIVAPFPPRTPPERSLRSDNRSPRKVPSTPNAELKGGL